MKKLLIKIPILTILYLFIATPAQAACNFHASMTNTVKDVSNWTTTCTIEDGIINGIDKGTSADNTAKLTLNSGTITINNGGTLVTGSLQIDNGSSIAIQNGGVMKIGTPLYITDSDSDGWASSFTLYDTADGRRRLSLMSDYGTIDCGDSLFSTLNVCTGGTGNDGAVTFSAHTNINTTNRITGRTCTQGGDAVNYSVSALTSTTATLTSSPASTCLVAGDEVLLINLQGISSSYSNVGNYEFLTVSSVSTNTITFTSSKTNLYGNNGGDTNIGTATSNQRVMLQRVPNYTNVTVNSGINVYPSAWDGTKGGVIALRASGTITITGTIHANDKGFRGGNAGHPYGSNAGGGEAFCSSSGGGDGGSIASNGFNGVCGGGGGGGQRTESESFSGGSGSASLGGGGGGGGNADWNFEADGGGGASGGYGSAGDSGYSQGRAYLTTIYCGFNGSGTTSSDGGESVNSAWTNNGGGGGGGGTYGSANLSKLYFGSGGGGGGGGEHKGNGNTIYGGAGGAGGGIISISSDIISITGLVTANGNDGSTGEIWLYDDDGDGGSGGGGAGGSVKIEGDTVTYGTNRITVSGGTNPVDGTSLFFGNSLDAGYGRIAIEYLTSISGSSTPTANITQM